MGSRRADFFLLSCPSIASSRASPACLSELPIITMA